MNFWSIWATHLLFWDRACGTVSRFLLFNFIWVVFLVLLQTNLFHLHWWPLGVEANHVVEEEEGARDADQEKRSLFSSHSFNLHWKSFCRNLDQHRGRKCHILKVCKEAFLHREIAIECNAFGDAPSKVSNPHHPQRKYMVLIFTHPEDISIPIQGSNLPNPS